MNKSPPWQLSCFTIAEAAAVVVVILSIFRSLLYPTIMTILWETFLILPTYNKLEMRKRQRERKKRKKGQNMYCPPCTHKMVDSTFTFFQQGDVTTACFLPPLLPPLQTDQIPRRSYIHRLIKTHFHPVFFSHSDHHTAHNTTCCIKSSYEQHPTMWSHPTTTTSSLLPFLPLCRSLLLPCRRTVLREMLTEWESGRRRIPSFAPHGSRRGRRMKNRRRIINMTEVPNRLFQMKLASSHFTINGWYSLKPIQ